MPPGNILIKAVPFLSCKRDKRNINLSLFFLPLLPYPYAREDALLVLLLLLYTKSIKERGFFLPLNNTKQDIVYILHYA